MRSVSMPRRCFVQSWSVIPLTVVGYVRTGSPTAFALRLWVASYRFGLVSSPQTLRLSKLPTNYPSPYIGPLAVVPPTLPGVAHSGFV